MTWLKKLKSVNALIITFVVSGVLIGVLLAAQFQSSVTSNSYLVDELNAQTDLLNSYNEDRLSLKNQITVLQQKLDEDRKNLEMADSNNNLATLDNFKEIVGLTKIKGKGVSILLNEGASNKPDNDASLIHASDLRDLVNLLRTARVEGISINDQRIVANSTISSLGSSIIINKVKVAAPFEIKAIGDTEMIVNRINDQKSYPDLYKRIKNRDVYFEIQKVDQVVLPAYFGDYLFQYAQIK